MKIDPTNEALTLRLADGYLVLGNSQRAKSLTNAILIRDPNQFDALVLHAIASARERDFDEARTFLMRAQWLRPDDPVVGSLIADVNRQSEAVR